MYLENYYIFQIIVKRQEPVENCGCMQLSFTFCCTFCYI